MSLFRIVGAIAAVIAVVIALISLPATGSAASLVKEAETLNWSRSGLTTADQAASGGQAYILPWNSSGTFTVPAGQIDSIAVRARGAQCNGAPNLQVKLGNTVIANQAVSQTGWTDFVYPVTLPSGTYILVLSYTNDYSSRRCDRDLFLDTVTVATQAPPTTTTSTVTTPVPTTTTSTTATTPAPTTTIPTTTTTPPPSPQFFTTTPSGQCANSGPCAVPTQLPRADAYCASNVTPTTREYRPENATANNTPGPSDPSANTWGPWGTSTYWANQRANTLRVTGHYTGLTTQIIQWGACKWGIDEDVIRAVVVQESSWRQSGQGDPGNGCDHSFGLTSVRDSPNTVCPINHTGWGGMPNTKSSTALNVDFYGSYIRTCYDGDLYDGGSWLYGGQTVAQIASAKGWDYVLWGCVGAWFSGGWYDSGAQNYINLVKGHLANRTWESYS